MIFIILGKYICIFCNIRNSVFTYFCIARSKLFLFWSKFQYRVIFSIWPSEKKHTKVVNSIFCTSKCARKIKMNIEWKIKFEYVLFCIELHSVFFHYYYACVWHYVLQLDTLLFKMKLSVQIWVARATCFAKKREATVYRESNVNSFCDYKLFNP